MGRQEEGQVQGGLQLDADDRQANNDVQDVTPVQEGGGAPLPIPPMAPLGEPSGPPQMMSQELIQGLAKATSRVAIGATISSQAKTQQTTPWGAAGSMGPSLSTLRHCSRTPKAPKPKQTPRASPYPPRPCRTPQAPLVITPQGSGEGEGQSSGLPLK